MQSPQSAPPQPAPQQPQTQTPQPQTAEQGVAQSVGWQEEEGAYILPFGAGVTLGPELLGDGKEAEIGLDKLPKLPGLEIKDAKFKRNSNSRMITLTGSTAIPLTEASDFTLKFSKDGKPSGFKVKTKLALDWLDRPKMEIDWSPDGGLRSELTVDAKKFIPETVRSKGKADGNLTLGLAEGKLSGAIDTTVTVPDLIEGHFKGAFGPDGLSATVALANKAEFLGELTGEGQIGADGALSATLTKTAGEMSLPVPGLKVLGGGMSVSLNADGTITGGITDLAMQYGTFASTTVTFGIDKGAYKGAADLALTVPGLSEASGTLAMEKGRLSGAFTLGKDSFPEGLPLEKGTITGRVGADGALSFEGSVGIRLGPAGTGQLEASYSEEGGFAIGATFDLSVPGMETASFTIGYDGKDITGQGELAVDPAYLSGIEGRVQITYAEGRWAGETTLGYSADDGKLSGQITVRVRQAEDDSLKVGGEGEVTAQIAPRLAGTLRAEILEEGGIDVSGEISVTEPLEMFPEARFEKELLNVSQKIPLWAILVAVLRIRAGVRAGIGPGVFRDIKVTGSYTIGQEGEPSFAITGEMFIPAFVEGYVGFGAGLGASVVLGSLTGGIEAMGTAGIYGAISVVPELAYENGDYSIEGVATMAAGARVKLSLNAWAEIEALWMTVWDNTWELASVTMPVGPDLGMQAKMAYTFGSPVPPTLEFNSSDIDTDRLIEDAMPKDGPPSAGVRDQVKNEAKWQGAQRAKGKEADKVPPELQAQAKQAETPPAPQKGTAPDGPGAPPKGQKGKAKDTDPEAGKVTSPERAAQNTKSAAERDPAASGTVEEKDAADTKTPRHPAKLTMAVLDEPPVPMPRTKDQQKADVEAAAKMVEVVTREVSDTDALDDYFLKIKERFQLSSIAYVVAPGPTISVQVKVNATKEVKLNKLIKGLPAERKNDDVTFHYEDRTWNVGKDKKNGPDISVKDTVGVKMVAEKLTPMHPQGAGPSASALKNVFVHLATLGDTGAQGYIKGHLLNDNLGGPGKAENLYPITHQANVDHRAMIEDEAKTLVNSENFWVRYTVEIKNEQPKKVTDSDGVTTAFYIDADMHADLDILGTNGKDHPVKSVVVRSRFNVGQVAEAGVRARDLTPAQQKQRTQDAEDFLDKTDQSPDPNLTGAGTTNRSHDRTPATQTHHSNLPQSRQNELERHPVADPNDILLSKARTANDLILLDETRDALTKLRDCGNVADYLDRTNRALVKRLEDVQSFGPATAPVIFAHAAKALSEDIRAGGGDISAAMGDATTAFRKLNSRGMGRNLEAVVDKFTQERDAFDAFPSSAGAVTAQSWTDLAAAFGYAEENDRVAVARELAKRFASDRATLKPSFRDAGGTNGSNKNMWGNLRSAFDWRTEK